MFLYPVICAPAVHAYDHALSIFRQRATPTRQQDKKKLEI
jgi:hypothetical protein